MNSPPCSFGYFQSDEQPNVRVENVNQSYEYEIEIDNLLNTSTNDEQQPRIVDNEEQPTGNIELQISDDEQPIGNVDDNNQPTGDDEQPIDDDGQRLDEEGYPDDDSRGTGSFVAETEEPPMIFDENPAQQDEHSADLFEEQYREELEHPVQEPETNFYENLSKSLPVDINDETVSFTWVSPKRDDIRDESDTRKIKTANLHRAINWIKPKKAKLVASYETGASEKRANLTKVFKKREISTEPYVPRNPQENVLDRCVHDLEDMEKRMKRIKNESNQVETDVDQTINDIVKSVFTSTKLIPGVKSSQSRGSALKPIHDTSFVKQLPSGWYKCNWCDFKRPKKASVQVHLRNVHGERVPCTICQQTFSSTKSLQNHVISVHEGIKPFECTFCGQKFPKKHSMNRHVSLVHDRSQLVACTCYICGNEYPSEEHLKAHIVHVHDTADSPDRRRFPCKICGQVYLWRSSLQKHYQSNHLTDLQRDPNVFCTVCGRHFIDDKGLRLHMLTHSKRNFEVPSSV